MADSHYYNFHTKQFFTHKAKQVFCASLLRRKFTRHVMYRARALSSKVNNNRVNCKWFEPRSISSSYSVIVRQVNSVCQAMITNIAWQALFTWLWRWLPLKLSKRQSPTTVLFRTTFTRTITLYELIGQIAITITLRGFNNLGRSVTPIFLSMFHFLYRFSTFCKKNGKNLWSRSLNFLQNAPSKSTYLASSLSCAAVSNASLRLRFVKTKAKFDIINATDHLYQISLGLFASVDLSLIF